MRYKHLPFRRKLIFYLDIVLFGLFILILSPRLTGLPLHEIIGCILFFPILIHLLIEWRWFVNYINRFFDTSTSKRDRLNLLLNTVLFISIVFQICSGLMISQVLLPFFHIKKIDDNIWRLWHAQIATISMFLVGFHLALNFIRIIFYFKKNVISLNDRNGGITIKISSIEFKACFLIFLAGAVALLSILILGQPSVEHFYKSNAIAEYRPTFINGSLQLFSQIIFLMITCFIARKWLKVKP